MKIYDFIDTDSIPEDFNKVSEFQDLYCPFEMYYIYSGKDHLVINSITQGKDPKIVVKDQIEIPIEACSWIADVVENGFWKRPSEGGLARNQHGVTAEFAGEEVGVSRSMNAGTDKPGFRLVNKSRTDPDFEFYCPQEISFADIYFKKYLLPIFRSL